MWVKFCFRKLASQERTASSRLLLVSFSFDLVRICGLQGAELHAGSALREAADPADDVNRWDPAWSTVNQRGSNRLVCIYTRTTRNQLAFAGQNGNIANKWFARVAPYDICRARNAALRNLRVRFSARLNQTRSISRAHRSARLAGIECAGLYFHAKRNIEREKTQRNGRRRALARSRYRVRCP